MDVGVAASRARRCGLHEVSIDVVSSDSEGVGDIVLEASECRGNRMGEVFLVSAGRVRKVLMIDRQIND